MIEGIKSIEAKYPGLDSFMIHWAEGLGPKEFKEQLRWFAKDVMPAFSAKRAELCASLPFTPAKQRRLQMAKKGYLVSAYRSIKDPDKLAAYAKLAGPAFAKYGAKYLARDTPPRPTRPASSSAS